MTRIGLVSLHSSIISSFLNCSPFHTFPRFALHLLEKRTISLLITNISVSIVCTARSPIPFTSQTSVNQSHSSCFVIQLLFRTHPRWFQPAAIQSLLYPRLLRSMLASLRISFACSNIDHRSIRSELPRSLIHSLFRYSRSTFLTSVHFLFLHHTTFRYPRSENCIHSLYSAFTKKSHFERLGSA